MTVNLDAMIERWRADLMDLSRRNRLLYFGKQGNSYRRLAHPDLYTVIDELDADGGGWEVAFPEEGDAFVDGEFIPPTGEPRAGKRRGQQPLWLHEPSPATLRRFLTNIRRRSDTELGERGVHVLYITAGMLEWSESGQGDIQRSPLILFPVVLERRSVNDPFVLVPATEEEIAANPALQRKMEKDFDLAIPDLPSPEEADRAEGGELCRNYFAAIRELIQGREGWSVSEEAWLGLFTFQKLVMFADLRDNRGKLAESPVVRALSGDHTAANYPQCVPGEKSLDREVAPGDVYHVVDADSSQFRCLEAIRRGASVVLQGPPGTGKSQTITNIVSQAIADGKSVLFVSEKMAALEVVHRRLERAQLGTFCLELHSHKANKREIVQQLHHALNVRVEPSQHFTPQELEALRDRRDRLNEYVEELHRMRPPFERTVYHVLGELAPLDHIAFIPVKERDAIRSLDARGWVAFQDAVSRIARRWGAIAAGAGFPWHGAKPEPWTTQLQAQREQELAELLHSLDAAQSAADHLAGSLERTPPRSLAGTDILLARAEDIGRSPGVPRSYHSIPAEQLAAIPAEGRRLDSAMAEAEQRLSAALDSRMDDDHPPAAAVSNQWGAIAGRLRPTRAQSGRLQALANLRRALDHLARLCDQLRQREEAFRREWNLRGAELTPARLKALALLHQAAKEPRDMEPAFLDPQGLTRGEARLREREEVLARAAELYNALDKAMDPSVLDLDLRQYLHDLRTKYAGPLRILKPGYHRLKKAVLSRLRPGAESKSITEWVAFALETQESQRAVTEGMDEDRAALGHFARGRDTDRQAAGDALAFARQLFSQLPDRPIPEQTRAHLCCGGLLPPDVSRVGDELAASMAEFQETLETCGIGMDAVLEKGGRAFANLPLDDLVQWSRETAAELDALQELLEPLRPHILSDRRDDITAALTAREEWLTLREELRRLSQAAAPALGDDWRERQSDWETIDGKAVYLRQLAGPADIEPTVAEMALMEEAGPRLPGLAECRDTVRRLREGIGALGRHFASDCFRLHGDAAGNTPFTEIRQWLQSLKENVICLRDLADIAFAREELARIGFDTTINSLLSPAYSQEEFPLVARKSILRAWLDDVSMSCPALARFREDDHERMLREFRELDRRLWNLGPHRVVGARGHVPPGGDAPGGEVAILRQEATKKRRHMPLRKLFENLPTLIQRLKPCLLMSPLSVSQFLKDSQVSFDLLVFDEASQIRTHDALGAIMRARQVVVCGDSKQLPPTDFFSGSLFDGDDVYDEENDIPEYESVLDACRATNMPETTLRWHYRSRHESLITYSNHGFYHYELVTFPSCTMESLDLGVQFEFVEDGIYDRGRKRINEAEAQRVVDLIVDIWRRHGTTRSVGVVAFSLPQANAILDLLEMRMRETPGLEGLTDGEQADEPLFVKNLENVQGDERDIIIFSICYGRDRDGRMTNNFGPINSTGGERRLNVAVTRARERLVVVSSIRPADIDISGTKPAGVRHLHKYLDYAERGDRVLQLDARGSGGAESPLEESVIGFLREKGYSVESQVGCSGFRIDIGVRHPTLPGSFVLGVECDGATYHSSATARDRDRLRQEVLENNYGWRIHRIWGPEWVANRKREEERLLDAIRNASEVQQAHPPGKPPQTEAPPVSVYAPPADEGHGEALPPWAAPFRAATLDDLPHGHHTNADWGTLLSALAHAEEGIHLERAIQLLREFGHIDRATAQIRAQIRAAANSLDGRFQLSGDHLLPVGEPPRVRINDEDSFPERQFHHIPPAELSLAMHMLLADNGTMTRDALLTATARLHGIARLGSRIRVTLEDVLDNALANGSLSEIGGRIALTGQ